MLYVFKIRKCSDYCFPMSRSISLQSNPIMSILSVPRNQRWRRSLCAELFLYSFQTPSHNTIYLAEPPVLMLLSGSKEKSQQENRQAMLAVEETWSFRVPKEY